MYMDTWAVPPNLIGIKVNHECNLTLDRPYIFLNVLLMYDETIVCSSVPSALIAQCNNVM